MDEAHVRPVHSLQNVFLLQILLRCGLQRFLGGLLAVVIAHTANARILGMQGQLEKEALALRVFDSQPMQRQIARLEALYRSSAVASTRAGQTTLESAAREWAMTAAQLAANSSDRPIAMWTTTARHSWFGLDVPSSGSNNVHPDNVYRYIVIDGAARYEIRGKINAPRPAQETFNLDAPGDGEPAALHIKQVSALDLDHMTTGPDGTFVITVDSALAGDRINHLQSVKDQPNQTILVRDTLSDWATQNAVSLDVRRISRPPGPAPSPAESAARGADILRFIASFWFKHQVDQHALLSVNTISTPKVRTDGPRGWGALSRGHFVLASDEALVVTVDVLDAASFNIALSNPWGLGLEYVERSASLNQTQARPDADGRYTFIIAAADPGPYNWLDTIGLDSGGLFVRWQKFGRAVTDDRIAKAVQAVQVVKLNNLKAILPAGIPFVTPAERKDQTAARIASWKRLLSS